MVARYGRILSVLRGHAADMDVGYVVLIGLVMAVGLIGTLLPFLPGLAMIVCWVAWVLLLRK